MAKQAGIITLKGAVGRLSFYKTRNGYLAREKGGVEKSRIMNDPRYARTRENIREFTDNANSTKLVRDALRPLISKVGDQRLGLRLNRQMMKILKSDEVSVRGDRRVKLGNWDLLGGIELNEKASLASTLFFKMDVLDAPTSWQIDLPAFMPTDALAIPPGAEGFQITALGVGLDFDSGARTVVSSATGALPTTVESAPSVLSIDKSQLSGTHFLFVLGVEFLQPVNGKDYRLNNGDHNGGKILSVSKVV